MKKVLALLIICLSCTMMFAQKANPDNHWTPVNDDANMSWYTVLVIDGVEQFENTAERLEVGVFDQYDVCRCSKFSKKKKINNVYHYEYILTIKGHEPNQDEGEEPLVFTFKIWDHANNQELDVTYAGEPLVFSTNALIGSGNNPSPTLNFTSNGGITKEIIGYEDEGVEDMWYILSSPIGAIEDASTVTNLLEGEYDFYKFDQTGADDGMEWKNYEVNPFGFELGKGYLYAKQAGCTITFNGTAYGLTENGTFELDYIEECEDPNMKGWNLMGNPYNTNAVVDREEFLVIDEDGALVAAVSQEIGPMEGIMVKATEAGQFVTFMSNANGNKSPMFALNVTSGSKLVDRAVVRFGQGGQLPKFQLKESTKVYIPMDGEEYSVVRSEGMGELPVNFKATKNGSYTMCINSENVSFGYLHLIDNLTGADQDLLANPSYTFEARTTDYTSRFKLVFATGNTEDDFAFFSNGSLVINNEGNATLQVVDVTGRIIKCENINGCASVNVDAASGVYMIRLVNGDNVKVQKVVK